MTYNIESFEIIKSNRFSIPLLVLLEFDPKCVERPEGRVVYSFDECEVFEIYGSLIGEDLNVNSINIYGEGSGHAYTEILVPLLKKSRGKVVAMETWSSGESVSITKAINGIIKEESVVSYINRTASC